MQYSELTEQAKIDNEANNVKPMIDFETFSSVDIRIGEIKSAEKVEDADKLLKLSIDTGVDVRTVVSGIAEHYSPEEIVGKKVSVLLNLAPRKIRGVMSEGMILIGESEDGSLKFIVPDGDLPNGSVIR